MAVVTEDPSSSFPAAEHSYEVMMGVGFGLSLGTVVMMSPLVFEERDMGTWFFFWPLLLYRVALQPIYSGWKPSELELLASFVFWVAVLD